MIILNLINLIFHGSVDKLVIFLRRLNYSIFLLKDNILSNLSDTQLSQTNDRIVLKTISSVGLNDYINTLPNGLNEIIENYGKDLPVGIKKRIGLARAIINNGKIIVLMNLVSL